MLTGSNFIGFRESRDGARGFRAEDPATGVVLEPAFAEATPAEVDAAARAAEATFEAYAGLSAVRRAEFLRAATILRFARPVCLQDVPDGALPDELRDANPRGTWRLVDGRLTKDAL